MDIKQRSSITSRDEARNRGSWIPGTPIKPLLHQSHRICTDKQGGQSYWLRSHGPLPELSHLTEASGHIGCYCSPEFTESGGGIVNYNESFCGDLRISKGPCQSSGISVTTGNNRISFMNQLALAAAGRDASSHKHFVAGGSLLASNVSNEMWAGLPETSTSSFQCFNPQVSQCLSNNSFQLSGYQDERCRPSKHSYDLNQPPIIDLDEFYHGTTREVAPETPYKSMRECAAQNINNTRDNEDHEVASSRIQEIPMHNDSELQKIGDSTLIQVIDNHNVDDEGNHYTGLNKMGRQKQSRKKHRPKVINERSPKETPTPKTPKQVRKKNIDPKTHLTGKRKYMRRSFSISSEIPAVKEPSESIDLLKYERKKKSCRRVLTFVLDDQSGGVCNAPLGTISTSMVGMQLDKRELHLSTVQEEMILEQNQLGIAYSPIRPINNMPDNSSTSLGLLPQLGEDADIQIEHISAQVQEYTPDKPEGSFEAVVSIDDQSHMQNGTKDHNLECTAPAGLTAGKQRWEPVPTDLMISSFGRPSCTYRRINKSRDRFPMHFPEIHKKKRTHRVQPTCSSNAFTSVVEANRFIRRASHERRQQLSATESWHQVASSHVNNKNNLTMLESIGALTLYGSPDHQPLLLQSQDRLKRKNSKVHTHTCKFGSLNQFSSYIQHHGLPFKKQASYNHTYMYIDAPVAKARSILKKNKRNGKQNYFDSFLDANLKPPHKINIKCERQHVCNKSDHIVVPSTNILSIESIIRMFERLSLENGRDISMQNETALVIYNIKSPKQNALILYRNGGTIVPFEGSYTFKKQRPRPKVLLDVETNKVWKLLMENINSEGVDGTDEQKAKWWNEERHVFHGRADSFIARMRLVQGIYHYIEYIFSLQDSPLILGSGSYNIYYQTKPEVLQSVKTH